jgi:hypothetical protein
MLVGLCDRPLTEEEILARRLFVTRIALTAFWVEYYWRRVRTRVLAVNREHELRYAF